MRATRFDLALGGEAFVEAFDAEGLGEIGPGGEARAQRFDAVVFGVGVDGGEVGADAEQGLEGDGLGDHEAVVAPGVAPGALGGAEEVADDLVVALGFGAGVGALLDLLPVEGGPAVDLVEQLGLEDPLGLLAAAAEAVDLVAERAVGVAVELVDDAGGELLVGGGPGDLLVEVDEVALVDAGGVS